MAHAMSHAQRRAAFLERAIQMFDALENWYAEHPDASSGKSRPKRDDSVEN